MISYQEAREKALSLNRKVNACLEYDEGYRFIVKDSNDDGDAGVVIAKDNGEAFNWMAFIFRYHPKPEYKEIEF